jgi:hypothetical protein
MIKEAYELGQQLALEELTKVAGLPANVLGGTLTGALLGGAIGGIGGGLSDDSTFLHGLGRGALVGGGVGLGSALGATALGALAKRRLNAGKVFDKYTNLARQATESGSDAALEEIARLTESSPELRKVLRNAILGSTLGGVGGGYGLYSLTGQND